MWRCRELSGYSSWWAGWILRLRAAGVGGSVMFVWFINGLICLVSPLCARMGQVEQIEEIRIVGNRRIQESTILYYIQSKEGDFYSEEQILRDYRGLLNTNFFHDAKVRIQKGEIGVIVIFEVKERPLVRRILYEGMKSFKESDVLERFRDMRVGLTIDSPFDESRIPKARLALRILLDTHGRPLGRVEVAIEEITSSAIKLIFKFDEGPKVRIGDIQFEGNTVVSDGELREALQLTKTRGPITIFKGHDKYIGDKLEYDVQVNMLAKYRERGYMEARAGEPKVEIVEAPQGWLYGFRKTKQQYYIVVPIEEGPQFFHGNFGVAGIKAFDTELVEKRFEVVSGEPVNWTRMKEYSDELKKLYSGLGYLDMDSVPEVNVDPGGTKTMDIVLQVTEGKQYIVNRIDFSGNTKTRDKVLRREFLLEEQRPFSGDLLDSSIRRLNQLGFFEKIEEKDYEVVKKPLESSADVVVKVKERSMQSIGLTAGASGISGSFFGVNYSTNNFRGKGQRIDVNVLTGTRSSNLMLSFAEPYFMDSRIQMGWSVFSQRFRYDTFAAFFGQISPSDNIPLFTQASTGFNVNGGYPIQRWSRFGLQYSLQTIRISDIDDLYRDFAVNQLIGFTPGGSAEEAQRGIIRSEVSPSFMRNTKDSYYGAHKGSQFLVQVPFSGGPLGGSFNVIKPFVEFQHFMPDDYFSGGRNTLALRVQVMHIFPFGKLSNGSPMSIPFFERIFSGGEYDLRGFDIRAISPWAVNRTPRLDEMGNPVVDLNTGLPIINERLLPVGGDTSVVMTSEYRVPLAGPLQVAAFLDFGTSTVLKKRNIILFGPRTFIDLQENTNNVWRASTGGEFQFIMPMINQPFRLIFAYNPLIMDTDVVVNGVKFKLKEPRRNMKFTVGYTF